eukprot:19336-Eustigmatos_ZCMA.PRE.1
MVCWALLPSPWLYNALNRADLGLLVFLSGGDGPIASGVLQCAAVGPFELPVAPVLQVSHARVGLVGVRAVLWDERAFSTQGAVQ